MSKTLHIRRRSADCETPLSAYAALRDNHPDSFLFESAEGGEHWGRYSIIGFDPACVASENDGRVEVRHRSGGRELLDTDIMAWLRQNVVGEAAVTSADELPFSGGAVGFFSYDIVSRFEPAATSSKLQTGPLAAFMLIDRFVVFDNLRGSMDLCVLAESGADVESVLDAMEKQLNTAPRPAPMRLDTPETAHVTPKAHISQRDYETMVEKAKEYILAGDIFQVVLSQRFSAPLSCDPLLIYRAVRHINPSPYLFHLSIGDTTLIGSSPEILVRKEGDRAIVRPIAGTRPRGKTDDEDKALETELLADTKELAEHVMLVDLGRNDLGRVCDFGSVKLTESMTIERYSHVMHIVSQVEGTLRHDVDALDLLAATFPAGTVSGAPKVRAMQIIDELEKEARGPYAGCIGYISFGGEQMDTAIAIRTAVIRNGTIEVQAGAGLVADSVPASEHRECVNKASAMFRAVELAHAQEQRS
ncbi:MAG TPA: anthranilate synthase component I [Mariprofundaceae bacterium]|nr:anthranilate synthase component I [Mariprofundaceae bacterium]